MEQFLNELTLTFCDRTVSGQLLHAFTGGDVAHIPASFSGFDIAAFLYELRHRLHRLLEVQRIFEGDAAVGPLHITDGLAAQALICSFVDVGIPWSSNSSKNTRATLVTVLTELSAQLLCVVTCALNLSRIALC